jgi:radical SAM protein with 4Fe4S-binding SPASM domain
MEEKVTKVLDAVSRASLRSPKSVTLMITAGCNLSCLHCWPESGSCKMASPVPIDNVKRLIGEFVLLGTESVCITGGEPLTHPDWFDIVAFSCRQAGLKSVCLQTNATLLTEIEVSALSSISFEGLSIQVSLEGATPLTHDRVRGPGSFQRAFKALRLLVEAGLGKKTVVAFTEMEHNFADLPDLLKLVEELGIGRLVSGTIVQGGRAARTNELTPPTPAQYSSLLNLYHADPVFRSRYKKLGNIALIEWFRGKSYPGSEHCTCIERPYINADGVMYPCFMLPVDAFAARGAYHRPLVDIILQAVPVWAKLMELNRRRSAELGECKDCPGKLHCAGGCMGRAYASTGHFMSVEDRCLLRKAVYGWNAPVHPPQAKID